MNQNKLNEVLNLHKLWLQNKPEGERADLHDADLHGANLHGADLHEANLRWANLRWANLYEANLRGANLYGANLRSADLHGADLHGADLHDADLHGANLYGAKNIPQETLDTTTIVPQGELIGYKKTQCLFGQVITTLIIPKSAKRSNGSERKCRCDKAKVKSHKLLTGEPVPEDTPIYSQWDNDFFYPGPGEWVYPDDWDDDRWVTCGSGIHFYLTEGEAHRH
jgi:hypothetical protein